MQTAASPQTEHFFRHDFYFQRDLPENLQFLETLSWNFSGPGNRSDESFSRTRPETVEQMRAKSATLTKENSRVQALAKSDRFGVCRAIE
jgi:hypothetical protein